MIFLFLILPVFLAGISFIIILKYFGTSFLNYPLDFGLIFNGKRILGKNKTIRGLIIMPFFTALYGFIIYFLKLINLPFSGFKVFFAFALVGLAYVLGELPNSFIKRRLNIESGGISQNKLLRNIFKVIDNIDSLITCGIVYYLIFGFRKEIVFSAVLFGGGIHVLTDVFMIKLNLKKSNKNNM